MICVFLVKIRVLSVPMILVTFQGVPIISAYLTVYIYICMWQASNGDVFKKNHDELDLEFLGNLRGKGWRFQTNLYGNGSTNRGREERYTLRFDPTEEYHRYGILWTDTNIVWAPSIWSPTYALHIPSNGWWSVSDDVFSGLKTYCRFYIDEVPIREVIRTEGMGADYPAKPMSLYATIWDGSDWATEGGRYKVDYRYSPFFAEFKDLVLEGCAVDPLQQLPSDDCYYQNARLDAKDYVTVTPQRRAAMQRFRQRYDETIRSTVWFCSLEWKMWTGTQWRALNSLSCKRPTWWYT